MTTQPPIPPAAGNLNDPQSGDSPLSPDSPRSPDSAAETDGMTVMDTPVIDATQVETGPPSEPASDPEGQV